MVFTAIVMTYSSTAILPNYLLGDQKLSQVYTANHATFPTQIRKITVQICGNFWATQ